MADDCYICAHDTCEHEIYIFSRIETRWAAEARTDDNLRVYCIVVGRRPINRTYWISSTKWNANHYDGTRFNCISVSIYQTTLYVRRLNRRRTCWIASIPFNTSSAVGQINHGIFISAFLFRAHFFNGIFCRLCTATTQNHFTFRNAIFVFQAATYQLFLFSFTSLIHFIYCQRSFFCSFKCSADSDWCYFYQS